MNMFARFDENPAMTLQVIKKTKRYGRTHARTDNVKTVYPPQTKFAGGIIKGNHKMQQHGSKYFVRRPLPTPPDPDVGVKIYLFQNMVMLCIKLKRMTNAATWQQIFCPQTPPPPPPTWDQ